MAATASSRAATSSRCDVCSAADGIVDRPSKLLELTAGPRQTRSRVEVAGRDPPRGGQDRTDFLKEQHLADEPGHQEAPHRANRQDSEVADERAVHVGPIGTERNTEGDTAARGPTPILERLGNVQTLDAIESDGFDRAVGGAAQRGSVRARRFSHEAVEIRRPVLDDVPVVDDGQHRARWKARSLDERTHPFEVEACHRDGRHRPELVDDGCAEVEARLVRGGFGEKSASGEVEGLAGPLERHQLTRRRRPIERYGARPHVGGGAIGNEHVVVQDDRRASRRRACASRRGTGR